MHNPQAPDRKAHDGPYRDEWPNGSRKDNETRHALDAERKTYLGSHTNGRGERRGRGSGRGTLSGFTAYNADKLEQGQCMGPQVEERGEGRGRGAFRPYRARGRGRGRGTGDRQDMLNRSDQVDKSGAPDPVTTTGMGTRARSESKIRARTA